MVITKYRTPFLQILFLGVNAGMVAASISKSPDAFIIVVVSLWITGGLIVGKYGPESSS